jgi:hypothetical protein
MGLDLDEIAIKDPDVQNIFLTVSAFNVSFDKVKDAFIRVYAPSTGHEFLRFPLTMTHTKAKTIVMVKLFRHRDSSKPTEWFMQFIGGGVTGADTATCPGVKGCCGKTRAYDHKFDVKPDARAMIQEIAAQFARMRQTIVHENNYKLKLGDMEKELTKLQKDMEKEGLGSIISLSHLKFDFKNKYCELESMKLPENLVNLVRSNDANIVLQLQKILGRMGRLVETLEK